VIYNFYDRFVATFNPEKALRQVAARAKIQVLNSGYSHHGANRTKKSLIGWIFKGGSPDDDITANLDVLRQRSRDLHMGAPIATSAIKTCRTNVVGCGLRLKSQIDAEFLGLTDEEADQWERTTEREFAMWCEECDAGRQMNFYEMQALVFLSALMSGDVFCLLPMISRPNTPYALKVNVIEADRVCNPIEISDTGYNQQNVRGGVEVDRYGAPVAYYIAHKHPLDNYQGKNEWDRVLAFGAKTGRRNVLHIMEFERPGQRRGIPLLSPVIESLKQLARYTNAELMAAVVSGLLNVFIESNGIDNPLGESVPPDQQVDEQDPNSYELGNGAIISLAPGERANVVNPARPNTAFDGFVVSITRQIGAALEIPFEILMKHFTASYSASRAALLEAWKTFRMKRSWLVSRFCQPVYVEWLTEAVARGRIKAPGFFDDPAIRYAYCGAEWHGPSQGQIDPLKEVNAAKIRVEEGFSTRAKEAAELTGSDFERIIRQRSKEERLRAEGGLIIEKEGEKGAEVLAVPDGEE
jgi:lambda family phage portal protein